MSNFEEFLSLFKKEMYSNGKISAIERLKSCGVEHDRACAIAETIMMEQEGYFLPIARLKRKFLGLFNFWYDKRDPAVLAKRVSDYLISTGHYSSIEDVDMKVKEIQETYDKLEADFDYTDSLYHYSSIPSKVVIVLINLHFGDLSSRLQEETANLIGKEEILNSISQRSNHMHQRFSELINEAKKENNQVAINELEIIKSLMEKHTYTIGEK